MRAALIGLVALSACTGDVDEQWQLDHDRIIAVRATPPGILPGETSVLDGLYGSKGGRPVELAPQLAAVVSPERFQTALRRESGQWIVTAPDAAALAGARVELGLAADAPVPLQIGVSYADQTLLGVKTVYLGVSRQNPVLEDMLIDGAAPPQAEIVVPQLTDVPLSVKADEADIVNWLTSCGTMHDFDLPQAYLRVEKEDPQEGDLAVVLRKADGGIAWRVWPIRVQ
ncbi:MAG: hypothetical protein H0T46_25255 [Deltaproteobacteria bacterium]|nr:hypothetical protein [Deltaproteobacteria bacterium]